MFRMFLLSAAVLGTLTACGSASEPSVPTVQVPAGGYCYVNAEGVKACEYADGTDYVPSAPAPAAAPVVSVAAPKVAAGTVVLEPVAKHVPVVVKAKEAPKVSEKPDSVPTEAVEAESVPESASEPVVAEKADEKPAAPAPAVPVARSRVEQDEFCAAKGLEVDSYNMGDGNPWCRTPIQASPSPVSQ